MPNIFFTSDWHFCHDKEFIYKPRGFSNIEEMNEAIVERYNSIVTDSDIVYCLGDCMLNDDAAGLAYMRHLKGNIKLVLGNHDTAARAKKYAELPNVEILGYAHKIKITKRKFGFLCHYPVSCANYNEVGFNRCISIHGHTHSSERYTLLKLMNGDEVQEAYNVAVDAYNCYPVPLDIIR